MATPSIPPIAEITERFTVIFGDLRTANLATVRICALATDLTGQVLGAHGHPSPSAVPAWRYPVLFEQHFTEIPANEAVTSGTLAAAIDALDQDKRVAFAQTGMDIIWNVANALTHAERSQIATSSDITLPFTLAAGKTLNEALPGFATAHEQDARHWIEMRLTAHPHLVTTEPLSNTEIKLRGQLHVLAHDTSLLGVLSQLDRFLTVDEPVDERLIATALSAVHRHLENGPLGKMLELTDAAYTAINQIESPRPASVNPPVHPTELAAQSRSVTRTSTRPTEPTSIPPHAPPAAPRSAHP
ncbi:hypothetical protein AB0I28_33055 [Phytomonospora sp. NPDC050363]|uniref:hypothetical protein n=1 Tax=Phytomonospora sp. NPDC050363 TaxID=3155642 RepID=UPI0033CBA926